MERCLLRRENDLQAAKLRQLKSQRTLTLDLEIKSCAP